MIAVNSFDRNVTCCKFYCGEAVCCCRINLLHLFFCWLNVLQRFGGEVAGSQDTRALRDEIYELENQVAHLQRELNDQTKQLVEEKRISEEVKTFLFVLHAVRLEFCHRTRFLADWQLR